MKRVVLGSLMLVLASCDEATVSRLGGTDILTPASGGFREFLVLGSAMSFEQCRANGGLIIHDNGSPMTACDPTVLGPVPDPNEFDHPEGNAVIGANE